MIEEALVEKEVYDAMLKMRENISGIVGTLSYGSSPQPPSSTNSPEWEFVYGDGSVPEPKTSKDPVASDVMAVGDVDRDPNRPVAPFIPATRPVGGTNPFPTLQGPMG